jgi:hypothetical protein
MVLPRALIKFGLQPIIVLDELEPGNSAQARLEGFG